MQIEGKPTTLPGATQIVLTYKHSAETSVHTNVDRCGGTVRVYVYSPAQARELAQQMRGVADHLVDFALTQEQPHNFAAAEVRP